MIIARENRITIRLMENAKEDFLLFLKWMKNPETMKYWEGMTEVFSYERVVSEYIQNNNDQVSQCIIEYDQKPIGFCQFCVLNAEYFEVPNAEYYNFVAENDLVYGIDLFLGEVEYRNQGIGTDSLKLLIQTLFDKYHADAVMIDPKVHNKRAIRCYHKCGFHDLFIVPHRELQDGIYHDSLIMGIKK